MSNEQRIFLIGPMGAGKTTIGRMVARDMGFAFADSDVLIEERTGVDITTIFDYEGEAGFRERESLMLKKLSTQHKKVIATGGGAVLSADNRELMSKSGFVVYLKVSIRQAIFRTRKDTKRPILQNGDPREIFTRLAKERNPLYESIANCAVDTDKHKTAKLKEMIINHYQQSLTESIEK